MTSDLDSGLCTYMFCTTPNREQGKKKKRRTAPQVRKNTKVKSTMNPLSKAG